MKNLAIFISILAATSAYAGGSNSQRNTADSKVVATSDSTAAATNAGNTQAITFTSPENTTTHQIIEGSTKTEVSGSQTLKNTPSVSGPPLVSSNDTCMGSSSGSVNAPGIGIGLGTTWTDGNCKMLKNAREMWNMGMRAAALALMCKDPDNREALEVTGFECPSRKDNKVVSPTVNTESRDPIVRRRMGLAPLSE